MTKQAKDYEIIPEKGSHEKEELGKKVCRELPLKIE